ncbi:putative glutamate decarboxylase [Triangularia verruculosa]|uniref:Glutamate decarboxylase n=1 Tax=Triangularia verruculosa TaxID=2587418 RepID=A0AAN6XNE8_9PEZI|nr:putative glutamate decarboxylase [Triangularia verruculosa]
MNGTNGVKKETLNRASEVEHLIDAVKSLIIPFIQAADDAVPSRAAGELLPNRNGVVHNALVESKRPEELVKELALSLPQGEGRGEEGLLETIQDVLKYSVNTWDQGFMDKLYASTNPVGVISELVLAVLNTNVHVYQVSPALAVIEKHTAKAFASLFGFTGPRAGGVTCQGGSSSNLTSIVIARNTLYPETKLNGNTSRFILFTSSHGHYSVEKAAVTCGFGSSSVWTVPVDKSGRIIPSELRRLVQKSLDEGYTPFYVNATAGTTVLGSYDPFEEISAICKEFNLWMHIDASWGGPAIFSPTHKHKLAGSHLADSLTVNPHKMLNCPVTCSFLLGPDMSVFHKANTLPAGYLFHSSTPSDVWDLADLTLQCGRKADSLKLALSWIYYGAAGFARQIDAAFDLAAYFATLLEKSGNFVLVSENPPPCLQICFYYAPGGKLRGTGEENTEVTRVCVERLVRRGYMVDYAPDVSGERGSFFRVVVNAQTLRGTVEGLVKALEAVGREIVAE